MEDNDKPEKAAVYVGDIMIFAPMRGNEHFVADISVMRRVVLGLMPSVRPIIKRFVRLTMSSADYLFDVKRDNAWDKEGILALRGELLIALSQELRVHSLCIKQDGRILDFIRMENQVATTNYGAIPVLQSSMPHTFNSLQALVVAMAKFQKSKGKKTLFGRDKGREAWEVFERELRKTMTSMFLDDLIERNAPPDSIRERLVECIIEFSAVFPNWQNAYGFAIDFFVHENGKANDVIEALKK